MKFSWLGFIKRVFVPEWSTLALGMGFFAWYLFIMIGAAILQAQDNPTREGAESIGYGQVKLSYLDAMYFLEVSTSSCGLGDIVPVTDGGRAVIYVWSFLGTGILGVIIGALVLKLIDWIYVNTLVRTFWEVRAARGDVEVPEDSARGAAEANMPLWILFLFNGFALLIWFAVHLIYAGVLYHVEPALGNLSDLTPSDFKAYFYAVLVFSQTICFGTDYNPKNDDGRIFWLFWHPIAMMTNALLFSVVVLSVFRYCNAKAFWVIGKVFSPLHHGESRSTGKDLDNDDL